MDKDNLKAVNAKIDAFVDAFNRLSPSDMDKLASPAAAFALGLLSMMALRQGVEIPNVILDGAMSMTTFDEARGYASAVRQLYAGSFSMDSKRIDKLQEFVRQNDHLVIHTGYTEIRGLIGLAFGGKNVNYRTLREALDGLK